MSDYIFHFRRAQADSDGYYHTRWDLAVPVQVVAGSQDDAYAELWRMSGKCPRRGFHFTAKLDKVEAVVPVPQEADR